MKRLALILSFALVLGVFSTNAQEKKVAPKKSGTEQQVKKPAEKKGQKKDTKAAGAVKREKKEAAKK